MSFHKVAPVKRAGKAAAAPKAKKAASGAPKKAAPKRRPISRER